jgi:hypothetical protein
MRQFQFTICLLLIYFNCLAQGDTTSKKLSVFIDCSGFDCDITYFKSEINVVDFLLDREAADVHVLLTSQVAGAGGNLYQMIFYGQNNHQDYRDTFTFATPETATDDEKRKAQALYLKLGLSPLIAKTPFANQVTISMSAGGDSSAPALPTRDKWNYWVFRTEANGELNYEKV